MTEIILIFTLLNTLMIIGGGLFYFKRNFIILSVDEYNEMAEVYNQVLAEEMESEEKPGGCGFFQEYLEDDSEGEEEEDKEKHGHSRRNK